MRKKTPCYENVFVFISTKSKVKYELFFHILIESNQMKVHTWIIVVRVSVHFGGRICGQLRSCHTSRLQRSSLGGRGAVWLKGEEKNVSKPKR